MPTLNKILRELEQELNQHFVVDLDRYNYSGTKKDVIDIISKFQEQVLTQLFSMEVVESQLSSFSDDMDETLNEHYQNAKTMTRSSDILKSVNDESRQMINNSIDAAAQIKTAPICLPALHPC